MKISNLYLKFLKREKILHVIHELLVKINSILP